MKTWKSNYFYGNKISEYGLKNGYLDYRTLSRAFDAVINNNIIDCTGWENWEQVNGFIDNSDRIAEIDEELELARGELSFDLQISDPDAYRVIESRIEDLEEAKNELENEEFYTPEIFQYFIISDPGAELLQELTDEIVFYNSGLDMYVWGVTHYGTSWDYVLTNIPIVV